MGNRARISLCHPRRRPAPKCASQINADDQLIPLKVGEINLLDGSMPSGVGEGHSASPSDYAGLYSPAMVLTASSASTRSGVVASSLKP
jgi:hypothetical protein